jgi:transposase-like protein
MRTPVRYNTTKHLCGGGHMPTQRPHPATTGGEARCPVCNSPRASKYGHSRGKQRFKCSDCGRIYTYTGRLYPGVRKTAQFQEFLALCSQPMPLRMMAAALGIALSTAFRWRHLYLAGLASPQLPDPAHMEQTALLGATPVYAGASSLASSPAKPVIARFGFAPCLAPPVTCVAHWMPVPSDGMVYSLVTSPLLTPEDVTRALPLAGAQPGSQVITPRWTAVLMQVASGPDQQCDKLILSPYHQARHPRFFRQLREMSLRYRAWMRAFRGVALKYLPQYTCWFNHVGQLTVSISGA